MCACDTDGLDTSRALDGTRAHACSYGRSIAMHPYMDSYMHTHTLARTRTSAAPPRTTAAPRPRPTGARPPPDARGPKGGAYIGQRRDGGGVPRADVRVERRRKVERLRADDARIGGVKSSHTLARMRARPRTHDRARECKHARLAAYAAHVRLGDATTYDDMCTAQGVCWIECTPILIPSVRVSATAASRGNRTRTHQVRRRTVSTRTRVRWYTWVAHRHSLVHA